MSGSIRVHKANDLPIGVENEKAPFADFHLAPAQQRNSELFEFLRGIMAGAGPIEQADESGARHLSAATQDGAARDPVVHGATVCLVRTPTGRRR